MTPAMERMAATRSLEEDQGSARFLQRPSIRLSVNHQAGHKHAHAKRLNLAVSGPFDSERQVGKTIVAPESQVIFIGDGTCKLDLSLESQFAVSRWPI